jgi:FAD-linked sulfhydryl oxidase
MGSHSGDATPLALSYPLKNVYSKAMSKIEIREHLGRSTWTLLHTMAATFPGIPSEEHKKDVLKFIYLLSKLYPCGDCAQHFQKLLNDHPPKVSNHDEFAGWLCSAHNVVNKRLGKPIFDCSKVDERWECGCEAGAS